MAASAFVAACTLVASAAAAVSGTTVNHTTVTVDARANGTPLLHSWKASVGSGHALLGLREDWQQQLAAVRRDLGIVGVRFHGSFDDDMGPVVTNSSTGGGGVMYNFTLLDALYDGIIAAGVTPIVELSFMPYALADCFPLSKCRTTMYYKGITVRPRDFQDWYDLVAAFAAHAVDRYGLDAVASWRFECWNELWGMPFGNGTVGGSDYMALYNASYRAVKSISPRLRIGGPATEIVEHVADFVAALPEWGVEADFVSTHLYPTDECSTAPDVRTNLNCFTNTLLAARQQAPTHEFLMTECVAASGAAAAVLLLLLLLLLLLARRRFCSFLRCSPARSFTRSVHFCALVHSSSHPITRSSKSRISFIFVRLVSVVARIHHSRGPDFTDPCIIAALVRFMFLSVGGYGRYNCGWKNDQIHDGESGSYAAAFAFRTVNAVKDGGVSALSWWTFSSIFEEGGPPIDEYGPFGANSAMQTVHGVPLPVCVRACVRARARRHVALCCARCHLVAYLGSVAWRGVARCGVVWRGLGPRVQCRQRRTATAVGVLVLRLLRVRRCV
jgi:hypothetical protein